MTDEAKALAEREAEALTPVEQAVLGVTVTDDASYQRADTLLTEAARHKAELIAKRKDATGGAYKTIRTIEGWFRPPIKILERCEAHLKQQISAYRVALEEREREARSQALEAAQAGDHGNMTAALQAASDAGHRPPGRSAARFVWTVDEVDIDKLPRQYLTIDWSALSLAAKDAGEEPPDIPGVTFKREARISARK